MPLVERSGRGFITGGVIDDTPDWLGAYNEGYQGAQQQTQNRVNIQGERQRQAMVGQEEARRQARFGWDAADRAREEQAWADTSGALDGVSRPAGPQVGLMDPQTLPNPIAPPAAATPAPAAPVDVMALLPEWARMEQTAGLPNNYLETISMLESSGGKNTGNGKYVGVFQIGPEVASEFGVTPEQLQDPRINSQIAAQLAGRNAKALRSSLGREPQGWEIYLAHQQGLGGALALLRAPTQNVVDALAQAYGGDRTRAQQAVVQNGGNPQMTAGEFAQLWQQKFGGARPQPFTGEAGSPPEPVPAVPGLYPRASRPGRMPSDIATINQATSPSAGLRPEVPQTVADGKTNPPVGAETDTAFNDTQTAGLAIPGPAPAAPPAPTTPPAGGSPGLAAAPPVASGEVVPPVSRADFAGVQQPGQGSLARQIMTNRSGAPTVLPDMGAYMVEPAKIAADQFELQQARRLMEQQYAEAVRFRDRAGMQAARLKAAELDAAIRLTDNMKAVAAFQAGDDNAAAQLLGRLSQGRLRLQPVQGGPTPMYNVYNNGQMVYQNVTKDALIAGLRSEFDRAYQAEVSAAAERQYARQDKVLESQLKISENLTTREADMLKQIGVDRAKAILEAQNPTYSINVAEDGTVTATPQQGGGPPTIWRLRPVLDVQGEPIMDGSEPRLRLERMDDTASSVPVQ